VRGVAGRAVQFYSTLFKFSSKRKNDVLLIATIEEKGLRLLGKTNDPRITALRDLRIVAVSPQLNGISFV